MKAHLKSNDKILFDKYINKAKVYLEYGSGGSTYEVVHKKNIRKVYSVESDKSWFEILNKNIPNLLKKKLHLNLKDLKCEPKTWGFPGPSSTKKDWLSYSNFLKNLGPDVGKTIDTVLIDGRFRVACALKTFSLVKDDCVFIFDDFVPRAHYHIILKYFNIIDKTLDNHMVILKKKKNCQPPSSVLISKYEIIPN